ncbi:MAG: GAF domain-containing protein [Idiomarina sp.]|nr:GAF domain-containing protein [Idiomarina sp.]
MQDADEISNSFLQLQQSVQPLLKLAVEITGLETTFVTYIDAVKQRQRVIWVEGAGEIDIQPDAELDWTDSMCRLLFNNDAVVSLNVQREFPDSVGAAIGMNTFLALPVLSEQQVVGSLCAASTREHNMSPEVMSQLELLANALSLHIEQWQTITKLSQRYDRTQRALSEAKQTSEELSVTAMTDSLTGLSNRRGF